MTRPSVAIRPSRVPRNRSYRTPAWPAGIGTKISRQNSSTKKPSTTTAPTAATSRRSPLTSARPHHVAPGEHVSEEIPVEAPVARPVRRQAPHPRLGCPVADHPPDGDVRHFGLEDLLGAGVMREPGLQV